MNNAGYRVGEWQVTPAMGQMSRGNEVVRIDARMMRLLTCLAERAGQVVSIDTLLSEAWAGIIVTPDSVYQAVATLRRHLGDDPRQPTYIATVPRLGYRLIAPVEAPGSEPATAPAPAAPPEPMRAVAGRPRYRSFPVAIGAVVIVTLAAGTAGWLLMKPAPAAPSMAAAGTPAHVRSVAVLPFLDLTDDMNEEPFADGMTEELIDKLSQVPGLRVPAPTASFYYKGKQATVADVAHALGVAYVLDGSVRKSGNTLRVAARLVRADDGFVIWSQTYDRNWSDKLMIQDDIASKVSKALQATID